MARRPRPMTEVPSDDARPPGNRELVPVAVVGVTAAFVRDLMATDIAPADRSADATLSAGRARRRLATRWVAAIGIEAREARELVADASDAVTALRSPAPGATAPAERYRDALFENPAVIVRVVLDPVRAGAAAAAAAEAWLCALLEAPIDRVPWFVFAALDAMVAEGRLRDGTALHAQLRAVALGPGPDSVRGSLRWFRARAVLARHPATPAADLVALADEMEATGSVQALATHANATPAVWWTLLETSASPELLTALAGIPVARGTPEVRLELQRRFVPEAPPQPRPATRPVTDRYGRDLPSRTATTQELRAALGDAAAVVPIFDGLPAAERAVWLETFLAERPWFGAVLVARMTPDERAHLTPAVLAPLLHATDAAIRWVAVRALATTESGADAPSAPPDVAPPAPGTRPPQSR